MPEPIAYGKALYYPHLHFQDNTWIKTAALYYDSLYRMTPDGFVPRDNRTVQALIDKFNFVEDLPTQEEAEVIATDFITYFRGRFGNAAQRNALLKRLGLQLSDTSSILIHMDKMGQYLRTELPRMNLAVTPHRNRPKFYRFERTTGAIYLTYLANRMAENRKLGVVTDNTFFQPLIQGMQADQSHSDPGGMLANIVIKTAVPNPLQHIPIRKIIRFRKHHDPERRAFYDQVNSLVQGLQAVKSQKALNDILQHKEQGIQDAARALRKSYQGVGINAVTGLFSLSVPAVVSGAAPLLAGVATGALFLGKAVGAAIDYRKTRASSPYAYVLSLRGLSHENLLQQLLKGKITP